VSIQHFKGGKVRRLGGWKRCSNQGKSKRKKKDKDGHVWLGREKGIEDALGGRRKEKRESKGGRKERGHTVGRGDWGGTQGFRGLKGLPGHFPRAQKAKKRNSVEKKKSKEPKKKLPVRRKSKNQRHFHERPPQENNSERE